MTTCPPAYGSSDPNSEASPDLFQRTANRPGGHGLPRRRFLQSTAATLAGLAFGRLPLIAGPFRPEDFSRLVPADKKFRASWIKSLFERGEPTVYRWPESRLIGMPVGGICAGQLYLGGDGRLWHWDIFNAQVSTNDRHYAQPPASSSPLQQGFALRYGPVQGVVQERGLDHRGWRQVDFRGEYPIGRVHYRDPDSPVTVDLEAFSPFIPLSPEDSALPATFLQFTVRNQSSEKLEIELAGWLENAVCLNSSVSLAGQRRNRLVRRPGFTYLECSAEAVSPSERPDPRPDIEFDDFERATYEGWATTGEAFGSGPVDQDRIPEYQGKVGIHGQRAVNSHASAPGNDVGARDAAIGTLTSAPFVIRRDFITFLIGGGAHPQRTCIQLLVQDKPVRVATGRNDNRMQPHTWDVRPWAGQEARIQIVDQEKGGWGNIGIDHLVFTDTPRAPLGRLVEQADYGTLGLALLSEVSHDVQQTRPPVWEYAATALPHAGEGFDHFTGWSESAEAPTVAPFSEQLIGSLSRKIQLAPGQAATVTFVLTWFFPNLKIDGLPDTGGRWYGRKFSGALAVADYVSAHRERLATQTRLWRDTWYEATLPYWFLDRTLATAAHLATNTCYWLGNGRFYAWEGVGCCPGTCTHVWHYAQTMARLFPALERSLRELVDYGVGFNPETGRIRFRAEHNDHWAVDGQAGVILRTYREHLVGADDAFLRRVWPRAKKAVQFLLSKDTGQDGIIDGPQHNTLDADWHGPVAWLSGLYLAALRAGEEMAREMGDEDFARVCREVFERGRHQIDERLFNGEYYVQIADPDHHRTVGSYDGCEIDQVLGDSWSWQIGLGRLLDREQVRKALRSLWRYNFTPDVGPYRQAYPPGRWYALAGEGGLLMCTWPRGESQRVGEHYDFYFNECMTGFEYQVAWHMMAEGMVLESLAITRTIHDRYHAARRNPWNEVECGDHYARAMASYGVFLAASGFEYHGPRGQISFAPRLTPENFRCAFTAAEGWGTYHQQATADHLQAGLSVKWGQLRLKTWALEVPSSRKLSQVTVTARGKRVRTQWTIRAGRVRMELARAVILGVGENLSAVLQFARANSRQARPQTKRTSRQTGTRRSSASPR